MKIRPILLAGTRVTGESMHIGTYFGWIQQIIKALQFYDVIILIADYQSLDVKLKYSITKESLKLKKELHYFLPNVPIIIESDIKGIIELGLKIAPYVKERYYKRIMPIRKYLDENDEKIHFSYLFYPSMMVANVLALNASYVFNKPEGKFQHVEILNDIIKILNNKFNLKFNTLKTFAKTPYNILSLDGSGPMKRNREKNGIIEIINVSYDNIWNKLKQVKIKKNACKKGISCPVIQSIWDAVSDKNYDTTKIDNCMLCLELLSSKINHTLTVTNKTLSKNTLTEEKILAKINDQCAKFLTLL